MNRMTPDQMTVEKWVSLLKAANCTDPESFAIVRAHGPVVMPNGDPDSEFKFLGVMSPEHADKFLDEEFWDAVKQGLHE